MAVQGNTVMADLALRISANSAELKKGLARAGTNVNQFGKKTKQATAKIKGQFSSMTSGIMSQFGMMGGMFGQFGMALKSAFAFGVTGAKTFKAALISTGIGAIIVALGAAVGALMSYFKNTKKGSDIFNKAMSGISAVISTLMHRINLLGEAIVLVMQGKFKQAAAKAKEAFTDVGKEIKQNYKLGRDYAERENKLKARKNKFIVREGELMRDVKKFREIADDKTKSIVARENAIVKALEANTTLAKERIGIAKEETDLLIKKNALGDNTYEDDQAEQEAKANILSIEEMMYKKQSGLKNLQEQITSDSTKQTRELEKQLATLDQIHEVSNEITIDPPEIDFGIQDQPVEKLDYTKIMEGMSIMGQFREKIKLAGQEGSSFTNIFAGMSNVIGDSLKKGENFFKTFSDSMINMIKGLMIKIIAMTAAALALAAAIQLTGLGSLLGITKGATLFGKGGTAGKVFSRVLGFADGGIVSGDTLARVGEYPGAKSNPEVIAPLSKLESILGNSMGFGGGTVSFEIQGDNLVGVLRNYESQQNNF